jgi:hypothetical protein
LGEALFLTDNYNTVNEEDRLTISDIFFHTTFSTSAALGYMAAAAALDTGFCHIYGSSLPY